MEPICVNASAQIAGMIPVLIMIASALANFVKPDSPLGKAIHFLALNIRVNKPEPKGNAQ